METGIGAAFTAFLEILVGGIETVATGIASGANTYVMSLFFTSADGVITGLSAMGGIIAVFAGIALAIGLTKLLYSFITSLGN